MNDGVPAIANSESANPFSFITELYDSAIAAGDRPIEFHIFDPQLASALDIEWLCAQTSSETDRAEMSRLIQDGFIRRWPLDNNKFGFTIYSPEEFTFIKELRAFGRYSDKEIRHILSAAQMDIDATLEVLPYDNLESSDLEAFRTRLVGLIEDEEQQIELRAEMKAKGRGTEDETGPRERLFRWKQWQALITQKKEMDLTERQRQKIGRIMFHLRFADELVRIGNAQRYRALIQQGYSPEAFFRFYEHQLDIGEFKFDKIDWNLTLGSFQNSRAKGASFPLRTPDFLLTEDGIHFHRHLTPADYLAVYERYRIGDLFSLVEKMGRSLWYPAKVPEDQVQCAGCGALFNRTVSARQYCSEKCRNRVKGRRWRERDPERARLAQVRYWKTYSEEEQ